MRKTIQTISLLLVVAGAGCGSADNDLMMGFGGGKASEGGGATSSAMMYGLSPTEFYDKLIGVTLSGTTVLTAWKDTVHGSLTINADGSFVANGSHHTEEVTTNPWNGTWTVEDRELVLQVDGKQIARASGFVMDNNRPGVVMHLDDLFTMPNEDKDPTIVLVPSDEVRTIAATTINGEDVAAFYIPPPATTYRFSSRMFTQLHLLDDRMGYPDSRGLMPDFPKKAVIHHGGTKYVGTWNYEDIHIVINISSGISGHDYMPCSASLTLSGYVSRDQQSAAVLAGGEQLPVKEALPLDAYVSFAPEQR